MVMNCRACIPAGIGLGMFLLASGAHAYEIRTLETDHVDRRFSISLTAYLDTPIDQVYGRLTNFDELTKLSDSIEESRQLRPDEAGEVIVYTRIRPCVLFVCKTLRLFEAVTYPADFQVLATVIAARSDFVYGRTLWILQPQGSGTLLQYRSEFEPGFDIFPVLGPAATKYSLRKQAKKFLHGLEGGRD
jgi:hypothetical protein